MSLRPQRWVNALALLAAVAVIRGNGGPPQSAAPPEAAPALACPFGYFASNDLCYPYSWSGVSGRFDWDSRTPH